MCPGSQEEELPSAAVEEDEAGHLLQEVPDEPKEMGCRHVRQGGIISLMVSCCRKCRTNMRRFLSLKHNRPQHPRVGALFSR